MGLKVDKLNVKFVLYALKYGKLFLNIETLTAANTN